ncbi:protein-L-isoaspartate(D-aspartate) O-methyltransferase [Streptomyces virginiae]|uniref:protein-L-isoaspartate(D-aspartate) O-methyltransferase n=1 Tax=Streptomyces virginiae TaxID=1961 RepID=UPI003628DE5E
MTVLDTPAARRMRVKLADTLEAKGALSDPNLRRALEAVPRHLLVPGFWAGPGQLVGPDGPDYLARVYSDDVLATQITDGVVTSSSTAPGLMLAMLQALDVRPHHQVLEVATATGYNAAILCELVGADHVITIEVDPGLAGDAERRLAEAGYRPRVVAKDGRSGFWDRAPYDRLIATCGFTTVPFAWVEQMRPGGVIVCPVGSGNVRLTVDDNSKRAEGRFLPEPSYFMSVREAGTTGTADYPHAAEDEAVTRPTGLDPAALFGKDGFPFLLSLLLPGVALSSELDGTGAVTGCRIWTADGSWARVTEGTAHQAGPRNLWDRAEAAHQAWEEHDGPGRDRFGLTVTADGQALWVDDPARVLTLAG